MANSIYLVGLRQGSPGCGGFSNTLEMPQFCFASFEEAEQKYVLLDSLGRGSKEFEYQEPYLIEATPDSEGGRIKAIYGSLLPSDCYEWEGWDEKVGSSSHSTLKPGRAQVIKALLKALIGGKGV